MTKIEVPPGQVRIRIKPGRGIGGVGSAGHEAWMDKDEADQYVKDGYVDIIDASAVEVPSTAASEPVAAANEPPAAVEDKPGFIEKFFGRGKLAQDPAQAVDAEKVFELIEAATTLKELYSIQDAFQAPTQAMIDAFDSKERTLEEAASAEGEQAAQTDVTEDHAIMKPENKRS